MKLLSSKGDEMENASQQAFLFFEDGTLSGQKLPISKRSILLGRGGAGHECDIVLPERQVSRVHAEIFLDQGRYFLRDLGSKNGTYLNTQPVIGAVELHDNDDIQIALCQRIRFIGADATLPLSDIQPPSHLRIDRQSRRAWIGPSEIVPPLSPAQYHLLELLYDQVDHVCTRDDIVSVVWAESDRQGVTEQAIDALVRRLRDRLAEADPEGQYVITVRGHGFRLDPSGGLSQETRSRPSVEPET
ncbi:MAG: FHA domain-containing protein [Chloroflexi bacterium]|nr:FHA domain-containing protein [Chloroflexota bacterium]MBL7199843.1 FHA domain-containing protein [Anaerolineae bacterium]